MMFREIVEAVLLEKQSNADALLAIADELDRRAHNTEVMGADEIARLQRLSLPDGPSTTSGSGYGRFDHLKDHFKASSD